MGVMCLKPFLFAGWGSEATLPMPMPGKDTRKQVRLDFLRMLVPARTEHIFFLTKIGKAEIDRVENAK